MDVGKPVDDSIVHVAPGADDCSADGTEGRPFGSLAAAAEHARPGQTIRVAAGVYREVRSSHLPPRVNLLGAGADRTRFVATLGDDYLVNLRSPHNEDGLQTLSGFSISGQGQKLRGGIWAENRNHVVMRDLALSECREGGTVVVAESSRPEMTEPRVYVRGTVISGCTYTDCSAAIRGADGSVQQMLGDCQIGGLDGALLEHLTIRDGTGGYGIKFAACGYFKNLTIRDVLVRVNEDAPRWIACASIELWNVGENCEIHHVDVNAFLSFVNVRYPAVQRGVNLRLHQCRIVGTRGENGQEAIEAAMPGMDIHDNVIENVGKGVAFWINGSDISVRRNVFRNRVLVPGTWGRNAGIFMVASEGNSYRRVHISENVFDGYVSGVFLRVSDRDSSLCDIEISGNSFRNIPNAICELAGDAGAVSELRLRDNTKDTSAVWVQYVSGVDTEVPQENNRDVAQREESTVSTSTVEARRETLVTS